MGKIALSNRVSFKAKIVLVTLLMVLLVAVAGGIAIDRVIVPVMESDVQNEARRITQGVLSQIRGVPVSDEAQLRSKLSNAFLLRPKLLCVELIDSAGTAFFSMGKDVYRSLEPLVREAPPGESLFSKKSTPEGLVFEVLHFPETEAPSKENPVLRVAVSGKSVEQLRTHLFRVLLSVALLILTISFFLTRWFTRMITRPVEQMLTMIPHLAKGRFDDAMGEFKQKLLCRLQPHDFSMTMIESGTEFCPLLGSAQGEHCITLDAPCNSCEILQSVGRDELQRLLLTFLYMAGSIGDYQEKLRLRYRFEQRLLDGCPDGIIANDSEGRIILFNKGAERLLGYSSDEVLHRLSVQRLYPPGEAQAVKKAILSSSHGGSGILLDYTTQLIRKNGTAIPIRLSAAMSQREMGRVAVVGFFHDLTELKLYVDALVAANESLNEANDQLARLNRHYIKMLGFVTHELKAPIANSFMSANALRQEIFGPLSQEQTPMVEVICRNLNQSMEMIRLYLDLSRIEKDEMPVHIQKTRIRSVVIDPIVESMADTIREQNVTVEIEAREDLEWSLDPDLFRSVFTNLIGNGLKYGEKSGRIRVRAAHLGDRCRMEVWNSGPGISKENQDQLFKKFRRLDTCLQPSIRGSGLGLFITKTIVERHGGRIWVESREGEWVNFIIELPAQMAS
jgi:PAS domain S-box-containing protein